MKNINPLPLIILTAALATQTQAATISQWTFENNPHSAVSDAATISGIAADFGNGTASGVHASAGTDWTFAAGSGGSATSLTANEWAVGDYWQFRLNTLGSQNLSVSWDQVSAAKGPGTFALFWSLTDGSFTQVNGTYSVPQPTSGTWGSYAYDLSSILALNNSSDVFFRLVNMSAVNAAGTGSVIAGGIHRVDNFTVTGTEIVSRGVPDALPFGFTACFLFGFLAISRQMTKSPNLSVNKIR